MHVQGHKDDVHRKPNVTKILIRFSYIGQQFAFGFGFQENSESGSVLVSEVKKPKYQQPYQIIYISLKYIFIIIYNSLPKPWS